MWTESSRNPEKTLEFRDEFARHPSPGLVPGIPTGSSPEVVADPMAKERRKLE